MNDTSASRKTRPSTLGDGSGLSPEAIEAQCPTTATLSETRPIRGMQAADGSGVAVDAAGGVIRALACLLVPVTLGLSYLPALFTSDHRALHDRLAGTRVVQE